MKVNIAVGRKADKFKVLYVGGDADKALEASDRGSGGRQTEI